MIKEITLQDLLPNEFYINKEGNMVAEISLKRINNIASAINNLYDENKRLNNIIKELDKQNGELGAELSITKDRIDKTNWWLEQMLKQATNNETKAIISGALELLLGSDKE